MPGEPPQAPSGVIRLYMGPFESRPPGWTVVGGPDEGGDVATDIVVDGLRLPANSVDCAVSAFHLERYPPYEALNILRELHRTMKPGGAIRVVLPDLDRAIAAYLAGGERLWAHYWASAGGRLVGQVLANGAARTPFTADFAKELLELAGFVDVDQVPFGSTNTEFPDIVEADLRPMEVFCLEARKERTVAPPHSDALPGPHLSWSSDPTQSFTVVWKEPTLRTDAGIEFHAGDGWNWAPARTRRSRGRGYVYEATADGLTPDTAVIFRVVGRQLTHTTRTAPNDPDAHFGLGFVADTGVGGRSDGLDDGTEAVVAALMAADMLFLLGGGDYGYADSDSRLLGPQAGADAWFRRFNPVISKSPVILQFGNHEVELGERWLDYEEMAPGPGERPLGGRCGSFRVGSAHFSGLFGPTDHLDIDALLWLDQDLREARGAGAKWLVVWQHQPPFAHGSSHPAQPAVRRALAPILERHAVDLHLSAHDQSYERTFPLRNAEGSPRIMSTHPTQYEAGMGVVYAKISPGGKRSNRGGAFSRLPTVLPPIVAAADDTAHHFAIVDVEGIRAIALRVFSVLPGKPVKLIDTATITSLDT